MAATLKIVLHHIFLFSYWILGFDEWWLSYRLRYTCSIYFNWLALVSGSLLRADSALKDG